MRTARVTSGGRQLDFVVIFSFLVILLIIFMKSEIAANDVHYVVSNFDNQKYLVRQMDDSHQAANLLAQVRQNLTKLNDYLGTEYPDDPRVRQVLSRFNPHNIMETDGNSKYTSYSVNKGEKMVLCLRARDGSNRLVDLNTLMFVTLHEYSHIMTKSIGHTDEFWNNFKFVLRNAIKLGIYRCVDYVRQPKKYCGIEVNNSPLKCSEL